MQHHVFEVEDTLVARRVGDLGAEIRGRVLERLGEARVLLAQVDDVCDVFGVHGVGGILGAILTGVFCAKGLGGIEPEGYNMAHQVWVQVESVLVTIVWSGVVSFVAYKIADLTVGLRVSEESERQGLDITSHGEVAYTR